MEADQDLARRVQAAGVDGEPVPLQRPADGDVVPRPVADAATSAISIARPADGLLVPAGVVKQSDTQAILDALAKREAELRAAKRCPDCNEPCEGTLYDDVDMAGRVMLQRRYSCRSILTRDGMFQRTRRCERIEERKRKLGQL